MTTPDLSKMSVRDLCRKISAQTEYLCELGEEADRDDVEDARADAEEVMAELTRRMTPPPGHVRLPDGRDVKVLGGIENLPMTEDGFLIAHNADTYGDSGMGGGHIHRFFGYPGYKCWSSREAAEAAKEKING